MTINRTPETLTQLADCAADFEYNMRQGMRSCRAQWDIEGTNEPLTLYANRHGVFIVEPGAKPVPVEEWLRGEDS